jgi:carbonic anhydrase
MQRIRDGVRKFRARIFPAHRELYRKLAAQQNPETLFVTCADSRIVPNLFTHTGPGEMFVERNPGNIIPAGGHESAGELASIEYAVAALGVRHVIVCGHSDCGAMKGILHPEKVAAYPDVARWLSLCEPLKRQIEEEHPAASEEERIRLITELNVRTQMENLRKHPSVAKRLAAGDLDVYGWIYEIENGRVLQLDEETGEFRLWPD